MKHNLAFYSCLALALLVTASFSSEAIKDDSQKSGKKRHIKLVKVVDGKVAKLDTLVNEGDVFVWQGDTIGRMDFKPIRPLPPGMRHGKFMFDTDGGGDRTMIFTHKMAKDGAPMIWQSDSDSMMEFSMDAMGDSLTKNIIIHKRFRDGDPKHVFIMDGPDVAPMPPMRHFRMSGFPKRGNVIDLSDSNIISYRKKDISGGREKIEIIRKRTNEDDHFSMNSLMGADQVVPPVPPLPPLPELPELTDEDQHSAATTNDEKYKKENATEQNK